MKNICELWGTMDTAFSDELPYRVGHEFAVDETLNGIGISLELPSIEEDLFTLALRNSIKNLKEGPLGLSQREFPCGSYTKQA